MTKNDGLSAMLQDEVMTEMADAFFSVRRAIDDEVALFESKEADLALAGQRALCMFALLRELLPGEDGAQALLAGLGVADGAGLDARVVGISPCLHIPLPWGLTRRARFGRLVGHIYVALHSAFDRYLNGSEYTSYRVAPAAETGQGALHARDDAGYGKIFGRSVGRTVGWNRYEQWCREINQHIDEANRNQAPSQVLGLARSMDVRTQMQERASGTGVDGLEASMDAALCLRPVACHLAGIGPLPELPAPELSAVRVRDFAEAYYARHREEVEMRLRSLRNRADCVLCHME